MQEGLKLLLSLLLILFIFSAVQKSHSKCLLEDLYITTTTTTTTTTPNPAKAGVDSALEKPEKNANPEKNDTISSQSNKKKRETEIKEGENEGENEGESVNEGEAEGGDKEDGDKNSKKESGKSEKESGKSGKDSKEKDTDKDEEENQVVSEDDTVSNFSVSILNFVELEKRCESVNVDYMCETRDELLKLMLRRLEMENVTFELTEAQHRYGRSVVGAIYECCEISQKKPTQGKFICGESEIRNAYFINLSSYNYPSISNLFVFGIMDIFYYYAFII